MSHVLDSTQTESGPALAAPDTESRDGIWRRLMESVLAHPAHPLPFLHIPGTMLQSAGLCLSSMSEETRTIIYFLGQLFALSNTVLQTIMYFVRRNDAGPV